MLKLIFLAAVLAIAGCGDETTTITNDTTGNTTIPGSGGSGGTSVSTTTTGGASTAGSGGTGTGGAIPCAPTPNAEYPALASYDGADSAGPVAPFPDEVGDGAAAGRIGPIEATVTTWYAVLFEGPGCEIPDPVTFALWTEPLCGLPTLTPPWQTAPLSEFTQDDSGAFGTIKLGHTIPPVSIGGDSAFVAIRFDSGTTCAVAFDYKGAGDPSRALWFGRVDKDGDGNTDAAHGWAELANPSDPSVGAYLFDLGFEAK